MKNTLTSVALAISMMLPASCIHRDKYERRVAVILARPQTKGEILAEAIKFHAAQEHPTVYQVK